MTPEERATVLRSAGWQQGSVLLEEDVEGLLLPPAHPTLPCQPGDWFVVISHTCDVLQRDLKKEPEVEILRLTCNRPSDATTAALQGAQHPLYIQLERTLQGVKLYGCIHERARVPRERLENRKPDGTRMLSMEDTRVLAKWIGHRYIRAAYPDAFNDRLRPMLSQLKQFWKSNSKKLRAVYCVFAYGEGVELPADEPYDVEFLLVHSSALLTSDAQRVVAAFEALWTSCWYVSITATSRLDRDFTLRDMDRYTRWDLDHLSFADPQDGSRPSISADYP